MKRPSIKNKVEKPFLENSKKQVFEKKNNRSKNKRKIVTTNKQTKVFFSFSIFPTESIHTIRLSSSSSNRQCNDTHVQIRFQYKMRIFRMGVGRGEWGKTMCRKDEKKTIAITPAATELTSDTSIPRSNFHNPCTLVRLSTERKKRTATEQTKKNRKNDDESYREQKLKSMKDE